MSRLVEGAGLDGHRVRHRFSMGRRCRYCRKHLEEVLPLKAQKVAAEGGGLH